MDYFNPKLRKNNNMLTFKKKLLSISLIISFKYFHLGIPRALSSVLYRGGNWGECEPNYDPTHLTYSQATVFFL